MKKKKVVLSMVIETPRKHRRGLCLQPLQNRSYRIRSHGDLRCHGESTTTNLHHFPFDLDNETHAFLGR